MVTQRPKVQISADVYNEAYYDTFGRFASYFFQIDLTRELKPRSVLEVGPGNGLVSAHLSRIGIDVTTCDFDKRVKPDVIADIRELPLPENRFDTVLAFEILEHIPFADVPKALAEIARVSRRHAVISVPYFGMTAELVLNLGIPFVWRKTLRLPIRIPYFLSRIGFEDSGQHYWEVGRRGYGKRRLRRVLGERFHIRKEYHALMNPGHYFLVLEKKDDRRDRRARR